MRPLGELRFIARVASMYYEQGLSQASIADKLGLSQAGVSRLLKRAEDEKIVRITVMPPQGAFTELEHALEARYRLKEVVVTESNKSNSLLLRELGAAAAVYVETMVRRNEIIGVSSWSEALLAMTNAMHPGNRSSGVQVVQVLGGVGNPNAEDHASQITHSVARLLGGQAHMLTAPGVVASTQIRDALLADPYIREVTALFDKLTLALVGIGAIKPSRLLWKSGNVFSPEELDHLKERGAVGDVCLRFFDANGEAVESSLDERVIGMTLQQLKNVRRTVGIAGGARKFNAIRGAILGGWINVLITDQQTAERLVDLPVHTTQSPQEEVR